jgi:hypothetical protein
MPDCMACRETALPLPFAHTSKHCIPRAVLPAVTHTNTLTVHLNLIVRFRDI